MQKLTGSLAAACLFSVLAAQGQQVLYTSYGDPTDEEQLYLELINRARANPPAEALRARGEYLNDPEIALALSSVDLNIMQTQFGSLGWAPPLVMNANLLAAARLHSGDMFTNNFQGHSGSDGSAPSDRISAQGYNWWIEGENVYGAAKSVLHGFVSFEVDIGGTVGGMLWPPAHRNNIHNLGFHEVGVGIVNGKTIAWGPEFVTQDFGARLAQPPLITGVVYCDANGNGFYDLREGIGGVTVKVYDNNHNVLPNYTLTARSGGYSVPVPGVGTYFVQFTSSGSLTYETSVVVSNYFNVKADWIIPYSPPAILSVPNPSKTGQSNRCDFTPANAVSVHQWQQAMRVAYTWTEGAESVSDSTVIISNSPGYSVVVSDVKYSGASSFHLAHTQPLDQFVQLNHRIIPSAQSQLNFCSRLGWAGTGQVARAQITTDGGMRWQDLYVRAGNQNRGQSSFVLTSTSLGAFAGQEVMVRFVYSFLGGPYYPQADAGIGFYVDDISISSAEELVNQTTSAIPPATTSFFFVPTQPTNYSLRVRAIVGDRTLDWGPTRLVSATGGSAGPQPDNLVVVEPEGYVASDTFGGLLDVPKKVYTLNNSGGSTLRWTATTPVNWISLRATGGTLAPGQSTNVVVRFRFNAKAAPGTYSNAIYFANLTSGSGNTSRPVVGNIGGRTNRYAMSFAAQAGRSYAIQIATNLSINPFQWTTIATQPTVNGRLDYVDPDSDLAQRPTALYRAVLLP